MLIITYEKYNIYLALKTIWYKLYNDLEFLLVFTYYKKDLLMDFIIGLIILTN